MTGDEATGQMIGSPIDGGMRIKLNDAGTHYIDVLAMLYNYRIVLTPIDRPMFIDRHWCYAGLGGPMLLRAAAAAYAWDGALDTEPVGWNKNGQTGEWRPPGEDIDGGGGGAE